MELVYKKTIEKFGRHENDRESPEVKGETTLACIALSIYLSWTSQVWQLYF